VRARVGTVTRLVEAGRFPDGRWMVVVAGVGRFRVEEWLPDDPYPLARVEDLEESTWDGADTAALTELQDRTRRVLEMAEEAGEVEGPVEVVWSDDPVSAAWQVCALAPVGPFDRQQLLEAASVSRRLEMLADQLAGVEEMFAFRRGDR
jgi:Lon protease-like protein